jgi:hypothetical protein
VTGSSEAVEPPGRWGQAAVLAGCVLLALVPWFSAAAVAPAIAAEWRIGALETAFLTVGVLGIGLLDPGDRSAWSTAFAVLALGPLVGIAAMARLRHLPEAVRMAGGRR